LESPEKIPFYQRDISYHWVEKDQKNRGQRACYKRKRTSAKIEQKVSSYEEKKSLNN